MLRISLFHPLPPRARPLTRDELSAVFGGCNEDLPKGAACAYDCECHSSVCTAVNREEQNFTCA